MSHLYMHHVFSRAAGCVYSSLLDLTASRIRSITTPRTRGCPRNIDYCTASILRSLVGIWQLQEQLHSYIARVT